MTITELRQEKARRQLETREKAVFTGRNWIEDKLGKRILWTPTEIGFVDGRPVYEVEFEDGTSEDYWIDMESKTLEVY